VENLIKCLGKWFDASLNDKENVKKLKNQVEDGLKTDADFLESSKPGSTNMPCCQG